MPIIKTATSFSDFKKWIQTWLLQNPNAAQLDGQTTEAPNPEVYVIMELTDIEGLQGKVAFHGDTKADALKRIANANLSDFVIVPPKPGAKYWRFHFGSTHTYTNQSEADGLYAYLKAS